MWRSVSGPPRRARRCCTAWAARPSYRASRRCAAACRPPTPRRWRRHTRLRALPWAEVPEAGRVHSVGHGRIETRTIRVIDLDGSTDGHGEFFPDARQALKIVRRRRGRRGRWSVQTVYAITSLDARAADPALLATWVRGHWGIEGGLHWVRDVVFAEDHSQVRTAYGPVNLAVLRTLAINALRLT